MSAGTTADLQALTAGAEQLTLRAGDVLVRQGDPSDALYFVVSGRFTVHVGGRTEPIAEIGPGQSIGEIGFFAGLPRTATVVALRDATVLAITRQRFAEIGEASPGLRDAVILSLARRLADRTGEPAPDLSPVRTIAVLPAGGGAPSPRFVDLLRTVFAAGSRAVFLTAGDVTEQFRGGPLDDAAISR